MTQSECKKAELGLQAFRRMRKKAGICRDCGKEDAYTMSGRTYCAECAEKMRAAKERARQDPEKRERMLLQHRQMQEHRRSAGLCPLCGNPTDGTHVLCDRHRAKARSTNEQHRREKGIPPRGSCGLCYQCGKVDALPGKRLCEKCYEMKLAVLKAAHPGFNYGSD